MSYLLVSITALVAALFTLFSGFGLGTLLLPVFAVFFPLEVAVAATALVHLANNVFKVWLLGRHASRAMVLRFGLPAAASAFLGAWFLLRLARSEPIASYTLGEATHHVTPIGLVLGTLIAVFALLELLPAFEALRFDRRYVPLGGVISGFFGGLSGHQGALRSAFLVKSGLDRDGFLGTSALCAVLVDCSRLLVYGFTFFRRDFEALTKQGGVALVLVAAAAAFVGSFVGSRLVRKVTLRTMQRFIGLLLLLLAGAIASGLV